MSQGSRGNKRFVGSALVALALAAAAAPLVSADSSAWRPRTLDCAGAGKIDFLLPPSEFMTAFLPLHEAAWARILTILQVSVVSDTYVSKPLASQDRDRLVTCGYTDPDGLVIRIVGVLTNGK